MRSHQDHPAGWPSLPKSVASVLIKIGKHDAVSALNCEVAGLGGRCLGASRNAYDPE